MTNTPGYCVQPPGHFDQQMLKIIRHPIASLNYYPKRILKYYDYQFQWQMEKNPDGSYNMFNIKNHTILHITKGHMWLLLHEYPFLKHDYIPINLLTKILYSVPPASHTWVVKNKPVKDLTVLDIGAGCGETAYFFFQHGAKKVICIEHDPICIQYLNENIKINNWNCDVLWRDFEPEDVIPYGEYQFDFVKMDIEGAEQLLLNLPQDAKLPPIILESHSDEIKTALRMKFPDLRVKSKHPVYETKILSNCG